jgi:hypothetical protein
VFVVGTVKMKTPLSHGLRCVAWLIHSWRPWGGCLMNVFPQRVVKDTIIAMKNVVGRNLEMKIQVLAMDLIASVMIMEDVVVDAMLILMISVVVVVLMAVVYILKMKDLMIFKMKDLMIMKILLQMMVCMGGFVIGSGVLVMKKENIIMVVIIEMTRTTLLASS